MCWYFRKNDAFALVPDTLQRESVYWETSRFLEIIVECRVTFAYVSVFFSLLSLTRFKEIANGSCTEKAHLGVFASS